MFRSFIMALALLASVFVGVGESAAASLVASVNLATQTMTVSKYGRVIHVWKVSTARRGYVTPRGSWRPIRMHRMWHSSKYENSPMPFSVFYHGGFAIHGTGAVSRLGTPASHGCVRLLTANAQKFYTLVKEIGPGNTRITVN